jgi:predicted DNA-binding transcriptional regulator AlpA
MASLLTSWKEIAAHLGKGVRTVQRWEAELGLPIRRSASGQVIAAVPEEIDAWVQHTLVPREGLVEKLRARITELEEENKKLREQLGMVSDA